jgi:hypothetical protein
MHWSVWSKATRVFSCYFNYIVAIWYFFEHFQCKLLVCDKMSSMVIYTSIAYIGLVSGSSCRLESKSSIRLGSTFGRIFRYASCNLWYCKRNSCNSDAFSTNSEDIGVLLRLLIKRLA